MINPIRPLFQKHFEARRLLDMGGAVNGGTALEIGCGSGSGIEIIKSVFNVDHLHAFDLDYDMVFRANDLKQDLAEKPGVWVGNARALPVSANQYDAVFTFGAIHHVIEWRETLTEVYRVLKPGGRFYVEEILKKYITHPFWGRLMDHPQNDRFDMELFQTALTEAGFRVIACRKFMDLFGWFIADKPLVEPSTYS